MIKVAVIEQPHWNLTETCLIMLSVALPQKIISSFSWHIRQISTLGSADSFSPDMCLPAEWKVRTEWGKATGAEGQRVTWNKSTLLNKWSALYTFSKHMLEAISFLKEDMMRNWHTEKQLLILKPWGQTLCRDWLISLLKWKGLHLTASLSGTGYFGRPHTDSTG